MMLATSIGIGTNREFVWAENWMHTYYINTNDILLDQYLLI